MNTGMNGSNRRSQAADPHVQEVIRSAEQELHELLGQRAELMKRIGTIKQTLAGLANIFGEGVLSDQLLTFLDRKMASRQPGFTRESPADQSSEFCYSDSLSCISSTERAGPAGALPVALPTRARRVSTHRPPSERREPS